MNKKRLKEIIAKEAKFEFARASGGPGGQNINRRQTKVFIFWDFEKTKFLTTEQKGRLRKSLTDKQLTQKNELIVKAEEYRTQGQNKKRAIELMADIVAKAIKKPKKWIKLPYSETRGEELERLRQKKLIQKKKELRKPIRPSDL